VTSTLPLISLFCGPGGFDEGFRNAGFTTLLAYDNDLAAVETHKRNHPKAKALIGDLTQITASEIIAEWRKRTTVSPRGVIGGSPCQSFSVSNVRQKNDDMRHRLPWRFATLLRELIEEFDLDFFVFENVPGFASAKHSLRYRRFIGKLERIGFRVFDAKLDAQNFGVPQVRSRVFVVGLNAWKYPKARLAEFSFPAQNGTARRSVADVLRGLPEPLHFDRGNRKPNVPHHPNHWCMKPHAPCFRDGSLQYGHAQGRSFRVLRWDRPSYTVAYGNREVHVHPDRHRRLSVYEAMLLQGFPNRYVLDGTLSDQIRLVSGAVSPPVAEALASAIRHQLNLE
jgi:DNA (cytosine-5)-methyltransferase 1